MSAVVLDNLFADGQTKPPAFSMDILGKGRAVERLEKAFLLLTREHWPLVVDL